MEHLVWVDMGTYLLIIMIMGPKAEEVGMVEGAHPMQAPLVEAQVIISKVQ